MFIIDTDFELYLIDKLKQLVRISFLYAKRAHDAVFNEHEGELAGVAYLQLALSKMSIAESVYHSHYDILERDEVESIFNLFDTFANELITDFATKHSHQWTDIEYLHFKEAFDNSVFCLENN